MRTSLSSGAGLRACAGGAFAAPATQAQPSRFLARSKGFRGVAVGPAGSLRAAASRYFVPPPIPCSVLCQWKG